MRFIYAALQGLTAEYDLVAEFFLYVSRIFQNYCQSPFKMLKYNL